MAGTFPSRRPLVERFAEKVDRSGGPDACWPWRGAHTGSGRPTIRLDHPSRRMVKAYRLALALASGNDYPEMDACHRCDNPSCCNPRHLYWGTHRHNMRDYVRKYGRIGVRKDFRLPDLPLVIAPIGVREG